MSHIHLILVILAAVFAGIAAFLNPPSIDRARFIALALLAFFVSMLAGCANPSKCKGGSCPSAIARHAMKLLVFGALFALLTGCAGTGEGGSWTPADTTATVSAINGGVDTYRNARAAYYGQPYAPAPYTYPTP